MSEGTNYFSISISNSVWYYNYLKLGITKPYCEKPITIPIFYNLFFQDYIHL